MDRLTGDFKGASMFATAADARIHSRLRQYEDTGLTPDEIAALRAELDAYKARWTETASDSTDYTISHLDGIYTVSDPNGSVVCEFIHDAAQEGGQHADDDH